MTGIEKDIFSRSELLLGTEAMEKIRSKRVILFGVGGVGSWCAESLIRNGIVHLTLVDSDCVCISNCNRQLMATPATVGQVKVEALRNRLLEINPQAEITALQKVYSEATRNEFHLEDYDFVIDAIDSLSDKLQLILHATSLSGVKLFSSMGAALRIDPTKVTVSEFWEVRGDPLAAAMRKTLRRQKRFPNRKFLCVHSTELPMENRGSQEAVAHEQTAKKPHINGSLSHITAIFGMTLAGLVLQSIVKQGI